MQAYAVKRKSCLVFTGMTWDYRKPNILGGFLSLEFLEVGSTLPSVCTCNIKLDVVYARRFKLTQCCFIKTAAEVEDVFGRVEAADLKCLYHYQAVFPRERI